MPENELSKVPKKPAVTRADSAKVGFLYKKNPKDHKKSINTFEKTAQSPRSRKGLWIALFVVIAAIILMLFIGGMARATVIVTPQVQVVDLDNKITAHKDTESTSVLGYQVMSLSRSLESSVPASGTKDVERKASGKITVFNEHSSQSVRLIANTRFASPSGKIYRVRNPIVIPGFKTVNGDKKPGELTVEVFADEPGGSYNLDKNVDLSVPGLVGTDMEAGVYAKTAEIIGGGFVGEVAEVSEDDLEKAETELEEALTKALVEEAQGEAPEGYITFPEAYAITFEFDEMLGGTAASDSRTVKMTATFETALIDESALSQYLARRELASFSDANVSIENIDELSVVLDDPGALAEGDRLPFTISGQANFVWQYDAASISAELAGIKKFDHGTVFVNHPSIDRAEVEIWPFWRRTFPNDPEKITIVTKEEAEK